MAWDQENCPYFCVSCFGVRTRLVSEQKFWSECELAFGYSLSAAPSAICQFNSSSLVLFLLYSFFDVLNFKVTFRGD